MMYKFRNKYRNFINFRYLFTGAIFDLILSLFGIAMICFVACFPAIFILWCLGII